MILLRLLTFLLIIGLIALLILQVLVPAIQGRKLFPAFRKSELSRKVEETRDEVETLREVNANINELARLKAEREKLEEALEADAESETNSEPSTESKSE